MPLGAQRYKDTENANTQRPSLTWLAFPFPNEFCIFWYENEHVETTEGAKRNRETQQFQESGTIEEYMLYLNLNGQKEKKSVKHQVVKTNVAQTCANYHRENTTV